MEGTKRTDVTNADSMIMIRLMLRTRAEATNDEWYKVS